MYNFKKSVAYIECLKSKFKFYTSPALVYGATMLHFNPDVFILFPANRLQGFILNKWNLTISNYIDTLWLPVFNKISIGNIISISLEVACFLLSFIQHNRSKICAVIFG